MKSSKISRKSLDVTNALSYKGYIGSAHFSSHDEVFWGKLEHIHDLITFSRKTPTN